MKNSTLKAALACVAEPAARSVEVEFPDGSKGHVVGVLPAGKLLATDSAFFCPREVGAPQLARELETLPDGAVVGVIRCSRDKEKNEALDMSTSREFAIGAVVVGAFPAIRCTYKEEFVV